MELTNEIISVIASTNPGNYALYKIQNGRLIAIRRSATLPALSGMTDEEYDSLTKDDAAAIVLENDRPRVMEAMKKLLNGRQGSDITYRIIHKNFGSVWIHAKPQLIGFLDGSPVQMVIFEDMSNETKEYDILLSSTETIVYVIDKQTYELLYANREAQKLWPAGSYSGKICYRFINGLDAPCPWCSVPLMKNGSVNHLAARMPIHDIWFSITCKEMDWHKRNAIAIYATDITAEKKAQEEIITKFHQSIQSILSANPDALCTFQLNLTQNKCFEGHGVSSFILTSLQSDTVDGVFSNAAKIIPFADDRAQFESLFNREKLIKNFKLGNNENFHIDYRRSDENGKPFWVRTFINLLKNPETADIEAVIYSLDISQERRQNEIFTLITSQEYDFIAIMHLDENKLESFYCGPSLPDIYHATLSEQGSSCSITAFLLNAENSWVNSADRQKYHQCSDPDYYRPLMDKNGRFEFIVREHFSTGQSPDAAEVYRKIQYYYLDNNRDTILVIESDVTESSLQQQKETERAKAEAEHITDILDSISNGICVLCMPDADHLTGDFVNLQMFRILGYEPPTDANARQTFMNDPLIKSYLTDAFCAVYPDDRSRIKKLYKDNYNAAYFNSGNYRIVRRDGTPVWVNQDVQLRTETPEHKIFYASYRVVDREIELQNKLEQQLVEETELRKQATAANTAKSEFLSRMSHDIRTPINAITGMTAFAKEDIDNREKVLNDLEKIDEASKRLLSLINDVLDISKAESGKIELHPEPYPFNDYVRNMRNLFEPLCEQTGKKLIINQAPSDKGIVVDRVRWDQIATNIISNAIKYTPEGGTISFVSSSRALPNGMTDCCYSVTDTGIGMSEKFQKTMFEPFTQELDNPHRSRQTSGTGLGLSIVKRLVTLMGGTISVKSILGQGTTITVRVTVPTATKEQIEQCQKKQNQAADKNRQKIDGHVLLAEDNMLNTEIAVRLLESFGLTVTAVENGAKAADTFASSAPGTFSLILMDIQMPVLNGYEAAKRIRSMNHPDAGIIPIIAMTADAFADDVQHCLEAGMNGHIAKPIDPQQLYRIIREKIKPAA